MPGNRRSIRLKNYNYAQEGAYYVTVCAGDRACVFGDVRDGKMVLNGAGKMVADNWERLPERFPNIGMDEFIVMPDHMHGVIVIVGAPLVGALDNGRAGTMQRAAIKVAPTLGQIIGAFKSITTDEYIRNVKENNWLPFNEHLWQRNYYERVIRDEHEMNRAREYIVNNPAEWNGVLNDGGSTRQRATIKVAPTLWDPSHP